MKDLIERTWEAIEERDLNTLATLLNASYLCAMTRITDSDQAIREKGGDHKYDCGTRQTSSIK